MFGKLRRAFFQPSGYNLSRYGPALGAKHALKVYADPTLRRSSRGSHPLRLPRVQNFV